MTVVRKQDFKRIYSADEYPDLEHLGEYSDKPGVGAIDRQARGDIKDGGCRYFNPAVNKGDPDYAEQDYQRMESYLRGEWGMCGVRVSVEIQIPNGPGCSILHKIESPGLSGVETDSGTGYFDGVFEDEAEVLTRMLQELGVRVVD